jgi:hypothetical protein
MSLRSNLTTPEALDVIEQITGIRVSPSYLAALRCKGHITYQKFAGQCVYPKDTFQDEIMGLHKEYHRKTSISLQG